MDYELVMKRLTWKEIRAVVRGYRRRERGAWERMRFHLWAIRATLGGKENDPKEIITFPWENVVDDMPTAEEVERVRKMLQDKNRQSADGQASNAEIIKQ